MPTLRWFGGILGYILAVDQDIAGGRYFKTRHHAQGGGLAATAGSQEGDQLTLIYLEVEIVNRQWPGQRFC